MIRHITAAIAALLTACAVNAAPDNRLVILHTNDTHSRIEPNDRGYGGILRRQVLIDSVRAAEPNVLLVDAGDAVQGSLFFSLFEGEVERKLMNALGYDIQILGNHEFDNGMESMARQWSQLGAARLCSNYNLAGTPLDTLFTPLVVRDFGGKKVAFVGLNLNPDGMIAAKNTEGVEWTAPLAAADSVLHGVERDYTVAVTHIGYRGMPGANDVELAAKSTGIDLIIGGHSHSIVSPDRPDGNPWLIANAVGDSVLIAQAGKEGEYLGIITIDLDSRKTESHLIPVDARLDSRIDTVTAAILRPYQNAVDSIRAIAVGTAPREFVHGSPAIVNLVSDVVMGYGQRLAGGRHVDMAVMNRGGIRCGIPAGPVTKGLVMQMLPFDNRIVLLELKGSDLTEALGVMAGRRGDGVSANVRATFDAESRKLLTATVDGQPIDPERTYLIATIDYLASGGDYMKPFTRGTVVGQSDRVLYDDWIEQMQTAVDAAELLGGDDTVRMSAE